MGDRVLSSPTAMDLRPGSARLRLRHRAAAAGGSEGAADDAAGDLELDIGGIGLGVFGVGMEYLLFMARPRSKGRMPGTTF